MRNTTVLALVGGLALGLSSCGRTAPTIIGYGPKTTGDGPKISGASYSAVVGKVGDKITIVSYSFDKPVSSISGSPVFVFKGWKAGAATAERTAQCALANQSLVCSYTVTPADVGQASDGIAYSPNTATSGLQTKGAAAVGTDQKSALLSYSSGISANNFIIGSIKF